MPEMMANAKKNSAQLSAAKLKGGHEAERPSRPAAACCCCSLRNCVRAMPTVRPVGSLSGGERFRASPAPALLLAEPAPQLVILDEPTNNLDLDWFAQLTSALNGTRGPSRRLPRRAFLADLHLTGRLDLGAQPTVLSLIS